MTPIIDRLQKLIRHEKSARAIGSVAEAEAFAAKIQTLLLEHKLSLTEVEYENLATFDTFGVARIESAGRSSVPRWKTQLASVVATSTFCEALEVAGSNVIAFIGRDSDRAVAVALFTHLAAVAELLCESSLKSYRTVGAFDRDLVSMYGRRVSAGHRSRFTRIWKTSFLEGFLYAISKRLSQDRTTLEATANDAYLSIKRREEAARQRFVEEVFNLKPPRRKQSITIHQNAASIGHHLGSQVSLSKRAQLGDGTRALTLD